MATVKDIYCAMDEWAPFETQMDFDNAGFLVGRGEAKADKVLVALDITGGGGGGGQAGLPGHCVPPPGNLPPGQGSHR